MDLTLQKMEKLLTISIFCHHFAEEKEGEEEEALAKYMKKLESSLEEDALKFLRELVACQKLLSQSSELHSQKLIHFSPNTELVNQLQCSEEKYNFLCNVLRSADIFLLYANKSHHNPMNSSLELGNDVGLKEELKKTDENPESCLKPTVFQTSVDLLQAVLSNTEYERTVRLSIQLLDVESLMNSLYVTYKDATGNKNASEIWEHFLPFYEEHENQTFKIDKEIDKSDSADFEDYLFCDSLSSPASSILEDNSSNCEIQKSEEDCKNGFNDKDCDVKLDVTANGTDDNIDRIIECLKNLKVDVKVPSIEIKAIVKKYLNFFNYLKTTPVNVTELSEYVANEEALTKKKMVLHYFTLFRKVASKLFARIEMDRSKDKNYSKDLVHYRLLIRRLETLQDTYKGLLSQKDYRNVELNEKILKFQNTVEKTTEDVSNQIKDFIKECTTREIVNKRGYKKEILNLKGELGIVRSSLAETVSFIKQSTKSLRGRRHYLEASLDSLIRQYDNTMLKYQRKLDELQVVIEANEKDTQKLQRRFQIVEDNYDEMRAMRRLKELLANMEKAEVIKQNWAARKIQIAWRKYKIAKFRKKKLKGKRKGKKKTPPPQGKGSTPASKGSTPGPESRSRSKSQTP